MGICPDGPPLAAGQRTVTPIDENAIRRTAKDCGKVLVVTEGRFFGGMAATISSMITGSDALYALEAPVKTLTAIDARVAVARKLAMIIYAMLKNQTPFAPDMA